MTIFNIPRNRRTPETEVDVLLTNLSMLYSELYPDKPQHEFINTYFKEMYNGERGFIPGDVLAWFNATHNLTRVYGVSKVTDEVAMAISCAYCVQALKAYDDGVLNEAWTYIVDARTWSSIPMSRHSDIERLKQLEDKERISNIRRDIARDAKHAKYYGRQEAFVDDMYQSLPNQNKASAATIITDKLIIFIAENDLPVEKTRDGGEKDWHRWVYGQLLSKTGIKKIRPAK